MTVPGCSEIGDRLMVGLRSAAGDSTQRKHVHIGHLRRGLDSRQLDALIVSSAALAALVSRLVDKNPPHSLGGRCEKMPAAVPAADPIAVDQAEIRLMH
jgi:hypothetical protein